MSYEVGQQACCILEICCGGNEQIEALAELLQKKLDLNTHRAHETAVFLLETFDLAPVGTLRDFKRAIAELARKYEPNPGY